MKHSSLVINPNTTLFQCMNIMELNQEKLLIICKKNTFKSVITIGDIQRAIIDNKELKTHAIDVSRNYDEIIFAKDSQSMDEIKEIMFNKTIRVMPVVDENFNLTSIFVWSDFFSSEIKRTINNNIPAVLMAGGEGTRLRPLTYQIPKPLIPINEKSISENIMDSFMKYGIDNFIFTVNYKAHVIETYFNDRNYKIKFIREDKKTGTAGSLKLIPSLPKTFIVNNCDVLFNIDYKSLVDEHLKEKNLITIVSATVIEETPYGVLNIENSKVKSISEKPKNEFFINTGLYVLDKSVIDYIDKEYMDITELTDKVALNRGKVGYFPISDNSWDDMGNWKSYLNICQKNIK